MVERIRKTKSGIKQLFIPGMWFEEMGLTYLGPIDGHDIDILLSFNTMIKLLFSLAALFIASYAMPPVRDPSPITEITE